MIVASLLLVIAAAVTLLVGLLNREVIEWVYASIACCLLAGLLLTIGVLRSRPSRKPVLQSGGEGQSASWAGASQWGDGQGQAGQGSSGDVMTRDEDADDSTVRVTGGGPQGDDEPTRTDLPDSAASAEQSEDGTNGPSPWAPEAEDDTGEIPDVRVIPPASSSTEPVFADDPDDDVEIVPKPSARSQTSAGNDSGWVADDAAAPPPPAEGGLVPPPIAAGTSQAESSDDAARFEQVLSPIQGVGPGKRTALLQHFGTYRKLRAASPEKLAEVPGISRTLAQRIHDALHSK